eukprot:15065216-Ditylum_brightwellii.AAC.1
MLSCILDAQEGRAVATCDIPGAFMQADMDEVVHMKLEGTMAELLVKLDPAMYRKYIRTENGRSVLYVELKKALYGTLQAAYLFWKNLTATLEEWGFTINPYDWCVANKEINGKQCTIVWHVDDLKISHVDQGVVDDIINKLQDKYGKEAPLTVTRGTIHDYLGMKLDFSTKGLVKIDMMEYIEKMLDNLPEEFDGGASTPAANHLHEVNAEGVKLSEKESEFFHHNVAKLLFLSKRARPDIQTAVSFLTTRVREPDEDDKKKLMRVMRYLRATIDIPLRLEADGSGVIKWWVDASFAVHQDMKGHTGAVMSLGGGATFASSIKQKINTH